MTTGIIIGIIILLVWGFFRLADKNRSPNELQRKRIIEEMKNISGKDGRKEYYEKEMSKPFLNDD